jgi:N-acetylglutamate synthase-like GNAT family acetyltransferase
VPVAIRDAQRGDAEAVARLLTELGYPTDSAAVPARLERLRLAGDRVLVAELDGHVAGLAHLHVSPAIEHEMPVARLGALVVDAACRGLGVGRRLVEAAESDARSHGCSAFFLTTSERRDDAHVFYERLGLEHTGRRYGRTLSQ